MAKKKEEAIVVGTGGTKKVLGDFLSEFKNMHFQNEPVTDWTVSTGSLKLDIAIGGGLRPGVIRLCGHNNEGKTPETLEILRQFFMKLPNSKAIWVLAEGRGLTPENVARCGLRFIYDSKDWEIGTVFVLKSNAYEGVMECFRRLVNQNDENIQYAMVVDSLDMLSPYVDRSKSNKPDDLEKSPYAPGVSKMTKLMLSQLTLPCVTYGHLLILISQVTTQPPKLSPQGRPLKNDNRGGSFSGGNSALHGADWIFEFQHTSQYNYVYDTADGKKPKEKDTDLEPIGKETEIQIMKSSLEKKRFAIVKYPIKFGKVPSAIWTEKEIIEIATLPQLGLINRGGSWLSWEDSLLTELKEKFPNIQEKMQGEDKMSAYLSDNPELSKFLYDKILHFISLMQPAK